MARHKVPNAGRINNSDRYKENHLSGEKEYFGEDVHLDEQFDEDGKRLNSKGSEKRRLANEIDDNLYEAETEIEIVDNPRLWGDHMRATLHDVTEQNYSKSLAKYLRIIKKTYLWLQDSKMGQEVTSLVSLRSKIGITKAVWDTAEANSDEFKYYSDMIKDIIGGRISDMGMTDSRGQIFKIFSIKNLLPDEYQDKKETTNHQRIEVIQVSGGTAKEIEQSIKDSKKRLKE